MLTKYIQAAMKHAVYEWLPDDGVYYAHIPELPGVWASTAIEGALPAALQEALEGWVALGLSLHHPLPEIDGQTIDVAHVASCLRLARSADVTLLIAMLRNLGFSGPYPGGAHEYMAPGTRRLTLPNPHHGAIGQGLLSRLLRQAGVTRAEWEAQP